MVIRNNPKFIVFKYHIGGLLQYGIPSMKLSKDVVKRRVDLLAAEGITFKTNCFIGKDVSADELVKENDAVLLTTGATWPRDLPLPKRNELKGIHFAMEFLESGQKKQLGGKKGKTDELFVASIFTFYQRFEFP